MKKFASGYKKSHHRTVIFDLTPFSAMSPPDPDCPPPSRLELIDEAVAAAKRAAHACRTKRGREHYEFALALLTESWIAEDGQEARSAEKVSGDVRWAVKVFSALAGKEGA
jgi:hypothetical protein